MKRHRWRISTFLCVSALGTLALLLPEIASGRSWFLPDDDDNVLSAAASLIEQAQLDQCLTRLDADAGVERLTVEGPARARWHYLRAFALRLAGKPVDALRETGLSLQSLRAPSNSEDRARVTLLRAWLYLDRGDWLSALTNINESVALFSMTFSRPHPAKLFAAATHARVIVGAFQRPASIDTALEVIGRAKSELRQAVLVDMHREPWASAVIAVAHTEGDVHMDKGAFAEAALDYSAAIEFDRQTQATVPAEYAMMLRHIRYAIPYARDTALTREGIALAFAGQSDAAKQRFREAIQFAVAEGGADRAVSSVGTSLLMALPFKRCEQLMPLSAGIVPETSDSAVAKRVQSIVFNQLAYCMMASGRDFSRAADMFSRSVAVLEGVESAPPYERATPLQNYGWALAALGKHTEAIAPAEQALALRRASLAPDDPKIAESASTLAGSIVMSGKHQTDPALKRKAIEAIDLVLDEDRFRTKAAAAYASAACLNGAVTPGGASDRDLNARALCQKTSSRSAATAPSAN